MLTTLMPARTKKETTPRRLTKRRELEIARTREDIVLAAARTLARCGYKAASMQDIANEVGFTAPALYGYFESKDEIFVALVHLLNREMYATFEPTPPSEQPFREKLAALVRRQLQWADKRRDVFAAFMAMHLRGESMGIDPTNPGPSTVARLMADWMRSAVEHPEDLGGYTAEDAAAALLGLSHGFFSRWLLSGAATCLANEAERIVELCLYGLHGRRSPARQPG